MNAETLAVLTDYSLALVRLRQNECKHLCVENIGPDILYSVIAGYRNATEDRVEISPMVATIGCTHGEMACVCPLCDAEKSP